MNQVAWETEHSVETTATLAFSWSHMSNAANWDDPPAQFRLYGPFAAGTRGTTEMPDQPPRHWQLRDVEPFAFYTIEFPLDGAALSFEWRFNELPDGRTRLTQHIALKGENAPAYLGEVQQVFDSNLAPGMSKIASAIDTAYAAARSHQPEL